MRDIAGALGVPERGVQLVAQLRRRLTAIGERTAARPPLRALVLESLTPPRAPGGWLPELLRLAGAVDAAGPPAPGSRRLTRSAVREADPQAVFVALPRWGLSRTREAVHALGGRAPWRGTSAEGDGRVFLLDARACFVPSAPRLALTLEVLAEALHADAFRFGHAGVLWERSGR